MEQKKISEKRRKQLRKARDKFNAKTYKNYVLHIRKDTQADVLEKLESVDSVNKYVIALVEDDIKKNSD